MNFQVRILSGTSLSTNEMYFRGGAREHSAPQMTSLHSAIVSYIGGTWDCCMISAGVCVYGPIATELLTIEDVSSHMW